MIRNSKPILVLVVLAALAGSASAEALRDRVVALKNSLGARLSKQGSQGFDRAQRLFNRGRGAVSPVETRPNGELTSRSQTVGRFGQREGRLTVIEGRYQGRPFNQVIGSSTVNGISRGEIVTSTRPGQLSIISSVERDTGGGRKGVNRWRNERSVLGGLLGVKGETFLKTTRDAEDKVTASTLVTNRKYLTIAGMKVMPIGRNMKASDLKNFMK